MTYDTYHFAFEGEDSRVACIYAGTPDEPGPKLADVTYSGGVDVRGHLLEAAYRHLSSDAIDTTARGGARPGAGRPPVKRRKASIRLYLYEDQIAHLKLLADDEGVSTSSIMSDLLDGVLDLNDDD